MTEIKEAPKTKVGNGPAATREVTPAMPAELQKIETRWFDLTRQLAAEMDRAFADFGHEHPWRLPRLFASGRKLFRQGAKELGLPWAPHIDVQERNGKFIVHADLPGMNKEDVKVEVFDDMLTLEGERKVEKNEEREGCTYSECRYGSFYRSIPLPEGVDTTKATADFRKGVLEVMMPLNPTRARNARQIEVKENK